MKTKRFFCVVLALMMVVFLVSCTSSPASEEPVQTEVETKETAQTGDGTNATNSIESDIKINAWTAFDPQTCAQAIIAENKGFFKEEGLNITVQYMQTGIDTVALAADASIPVTFGADAPKAAVNDLPLKYVAGLANIGGTQGAVARKGLKINSPKDLEGKTIGVMDGAAVLMAFINICEEFDLDYNSLNFKNLDASGQLAALENQEIDIMACWEPFLDLAVKSGGTMLFNGVQSFIPGAEGDVTWCSLYNPLCMREDFIKEHPQEAQAVVRAMIKSNDFINNNLKEAAEIVADKLQLEPEQTEMIMSKNIYGVFFDNDLKKAVQNLNEFYLSQGQIPYVPEFEDYADPSVVLAVDPSIVSEELK